MATPITRPDAYAIHSAYEPATTSVISRSIATPPIPHFNQQGSSVTFARTDLSPHNIALSKNQEGQTPRNVLLQTAATQSHGTPPAWASNTFVHALPALALTASTAISANTVWQAGAGLAGMSSGELLAGSARTLMSFIPQALTFLRGTSILGAFIPTSIGDSYIPMQGRLPNHDTIANTGYQPHSFDTSIPARQPEAHDVRLPHEGYLADKASPALPGRSTAPELPGLEGRLIHAHQDPREHVLLSQSDEPVAPSAQSGSANNDATGPAPGQDGYHGISKLELKYPPGFVEARIPDEMGWQKALFKAETPKDGEVTVVDLQRGSLKKGTGGSFLAHALASTNTVPTRRLTIKGITEPNTVAAHKAGSDAATSVWGKTVSSALQELKITPRSFRFEVVREPRSLAGQRLDLVIEIESKRPTSGD